MILDPHLLVFKTVVKFSSFSRAAEALNMTQPAVSQQIHSLEEYYGAKLLERNNKRVTLTEAGAILARYADDILRLHEEAKQSIDDLKGLTRGRLRIGATLTIGEYVIPQVISSFIKLYPEVDVSLIIANTDNIVESSLAHKIDVGLVEGPVQHQQFQIETFLQDEMVLIVPKEHPLAGLKHLLPELLQDQTFVMREEGSGTRVVTEMILSTLGIVPRRTLSFGSSQAIKEAVAAGIGISFTSIWVVQREVTDGVLIPLRIKETPLYRPLSLVMRTTQFTSRAISEFTNLVKTYPYQNPLQQSNYTEL